MIPQRLDSSAANDIVDVMSDAFYDYPVMRYVLGDSEENYEGRLNRLNHLFVMGRALRDEPLIGITENGSLCAAATMSYPDKQSPTPAGFEELREKVWAELGDEARGRYERCVAAWEPLVVDLPQIHLNMIGVRRTLHGRKLGRMLLDEVQEISRRTPGSRGVSLTTELSQNVELYEHMGYVITGEVNVTPELKTWALFRYD